MSPKGLKETVVLKQIRKLNGKKAKTESLFNNLAKSRSGFLLKETELNFVKPCCIDILKSSCKKILWDLILRF